MSYFEEFLERATRTGASREKLLEMATIKDIKAYYEEMEEDERKKVFVSGNKRQEKS